MRIKKSFFLIYFITVALLLISARFLNPKSSQDIYAPPSNENPQALIPTCLDRSDIPLNEYHWLHLPTTSDELATREYYGFLAGELIKNGVVDASDCPLGGVWPTGYANACGLERSEDIVFELQNIYDDEILQVGREVGVPPVMLKQLLRYESQFWPIRYGVYHFGLGHLTLVGAANVIQWSPELYNEMCFQVYNGPCPTAYNQTNVGFDNLLSGQLLSLLDASCPDCPYKIDLEKAQESVSYIGQALMSYCRQSSQIVYNVTNQHSGYSVDYATIWKLTLLNYNAGPQCVYTALDNAYSGGEITWSAVVANVPAGPCQSGLDYVNNITAPYYSFTP